MIFTGTNSLLFSTSETLALTSLLPSSQNSCNGSSLAENGGDHCSVSLTLHLGCLSILLTISLRISGRGYWTLFHHWMNRSSNWPLRRPSNAFPIFPKPYLSLLRSKASVRLLPRRFWPPTRRMLRLSCPTR